MALTRFKDARANEDGPVSGALSCIPIIFSALATNTTYSQRITMPSGAAFKVTDATVQADAVTSDPSLTIGTSNAGTQIVAAVNVTTNLGGTTIKTYTPAKTGIIDVVVVTDTGDSGTNLNINLYGYMIHPPTSVLTSGRGGQAGY